MSLIKDVKDEVKILPLDKKSLRKFGLMVGGIFIAISALLFFNDNTGILFWILILIGGGLFLFGLISPMLLRSVYIGWMTMAIVLGWFVSRVILTILFFLVMTPIGLIAKLFGKKFLNLKFRDGKASYWNMRQADKKINYTKMY